DGIERPPLHRRGRVPLAPRLLRRALRGTRQAARRNRGPLRRTVGAEYPRAQARGVLRRGEGVRRWGALAPDDRGAAPARRGRARTPLPPQLAPRRGLRPGQRRRTAALRDELELLTMPSASGRQLPAGACRELMADRAFRSLGSRPRAS